jgi:tetratricopeptide (TPR) repeat protein
VDFADNYVSLAITYKYEGLYNEAIEVCRYCIENFSDIEYIRYEIAQAYLCKGQLDKALEEINRAQSLFPFTSYYYGALIWLKGNILMCMEDWLNAEKEYQRLLDSQRSRFWPGYGFGQLGYMLETQGRLKASIEMFEQGMRDAEDKDLFRWQLTFHRHLAHGYLQTGNLAEALEEVVEAIKLAETYAGQRIQVKAQFLKGEIYLRMDSIEEAQKTADEIKIIVENGLNTKLIRYYYLLKGLIEFKKNNFDEAEEYHVQALSLLPFQVPYSEAIGDLAVFYDAIAKTYLKLEELDKAQENYEKIISFTDGRLKFGVIYAKAFYILGKIHEQKGDQAKAIENYEKFYNFLLSTF